MEEEGEKHQREYSFRKSSWEFKIMASGKKGGKKPHNRELEDKGESRCDHVLPHHFLHKMPRSRTLFCTPFSLDFTVYPIDLSRLVVSNFRVLLEMHCFPFGPHAKLPVYVDWRCEVVIVVVNNAASYLSSVAVGWGPLPGGSQMPSVSWREGGREGLSALLHKSHFRNPVISKGAKNEKKEEEEEQVPTDGGTSAEAMQVPLEEDDELEEEEIINDENFLGKRPLDSPEAEEMPAMKRPRLLSTKGETLDVVLLEAREPLSSINPQKIPPMLSPVHVQDSTDLAPPSPEPPMLAPVAKSQMPTAKPLEAKSFTPKAKTKTGSPGQKTKSPKTAASPAVVGSPIRSPKTVSKEKKSPGRSKSPKSPKSPKVMTHIPQAPVRPETPNRTPSATLSEKSSKETLQVKQAQAPPDAGKLNSENPPKKAVVTDKTIDASIDAVIARACAEREPDPFEFSSGSESEGDIFTSPKRISGSECAAPKAAAASNSASIASRSHGSPKPGEEGPSLPNSQPPDPAASPPPGPTSFACSVSQFRALFSAPDAAPAALHTCLLQSSVSGALKPSVVPLDASKSYLPVTSEAPWGWRGGDWPFVDLSSCEFAFQARQLMTHSIYFTILWWGNSVISKVVPAPEAKPAPSLNRPKTPPPAPAPAPIPMHVTPAPVPLPLLAQATAPPALMPAPSPAISGAASSKAPVRSVVTETVSTYVIRDEWGNQIWICPGCNKPDDGSPMIGCDDCDDWYHWRRMTLPGPGGPILHEAALKEERGGLGTLKASGIPRSNPQPPDMRQDN
ncbi:hypothetical protein CB1_115005001, partial [Camelus ferus]